MPFDASCEIKERPPHAYDHGHLAMTYGLRTLTIGVHVNSPHGVVRRPSAMRYAHPIKLGATRTPWRAFSYTALLVLIILGDDLQRVQRACFCAIPIGVRSVPALACTPWS
jgi:hypothetical protein